MRLESACGVPDYTNYTDGFVACIDWIFSDADNFSVEKVGVFIWLFLMNNQVSCIHVNIFIHAPL